LHAVSAARHFVNISKMVSILRPGEELLGSGVRYGASRPMVKRPVSPVLQFLKQLVADPGMKDLPDHNLLQRFIAQHDEAAFAVLIRRYGTTACGDGMTPAAELQPGQAFDRDTGEAGSETPRKQISEGTRTQGYTIGPPRG
jgi:hypothetical protein